MYFAMLHLSLNLICLSVLLYGLEASLQFVERRHFYCVAQDIQVYAIFAKSLVLWLFAFRGQGPYSPETRLFTTEIHQQSNQCSHVFQAYGF